MRDLQADANRFCDTDLGIQQVATFARYAAELADWNTRANLTAITDPEEVHIKHFLDSLSCLVAMQGTVMDRIIDVGTGAGFPGIPLKIANSEMQLTLVEATQKKTAFCAHLAQVLALDGVEVLHARAEDVGRMPTHRESYDWALAHAVAPLNTLVEYLLALVRPGGFMLAQKGVSAHEEATRAQAAITNMGGKLKDIIEVHLPGISDKRYLVLVEKVGTTPKEYPRRVGVPAKRPLG